MYFCPLLLLLSLASHKRTSKFITWKNFEELFLFASFDTLYTCIIMISFSYKIFFSSSSFHEFHVNDKRRKNLFATSRAFSVVLFLLSKKFYLQNSIYVYNKVVKDSIWSNTHKGRKLGNLKDKTALKVNRDSLLVDCLVLLECFFCSNAF